jgi:hypothetical protein
MDCREYKYTEEVLKYVRFKYDRIDIRQELNEHIEDMLEYAPQMNEEETEAYIRENMGDAEVLGKELDREHKPLLGWIWRISRAMAIVIALLCIPTVINVALLSVYTVHSVIVGYDDWRTKEGIEYTVETDIKGKIDDTYIFVDGVDKYENGKMVIKYKTIHNPFGKSAGWTFSLGNFYDEFGTRYYGGGGSGGGFISYHVADINDFNPDAQKLIIDYNYNGRIFYAQIPLEWEAVK